MLTNSTGQLVTSAVILLRLPPDSLTHRAEQLFPHLQCSATIMETRTVQRLLHHGAFSVSIGGINEYTGINLLVYISL